MDGDKAKAESLENKVKSSHTWLGGVLVPFLKDSSTCRIFVLALLGIIFNFILVPLLEDYVFFLELVATFISFYSMASLLLS